MDLAADDRIGTVSLLLVGPAAITARQICRFVKTVFVTFVPVLSVVATRSLVLPQIGRNHSAVVLEEVIPVVDARPRAMLFLVKWLDDAVTNFALCVLGSVLLLDVLVHLHQLLLPLLLLVLLHELLQHFLSSLLALLPDVLFDQFVNTAKFLLVGLA